VPQAAGILSLIGTGVSAASAYNQGQVQRAMLRNQAILGEQQAEETLKTGVINQNNYRRQINALIGRQRAVIAANNVQNAGSPLALQEDTAAIGEADIANIRNQAALDAWGFKVGADQARYRGDLYASAGATSAFGDVLAAGGQLYGLYKNRQKPILGGSTQANGKY
jgi:hypothetical protein